jgi:hypothetical protein
MFVITMFRDHSFYYRCSDLSYCFRRTVTRPGGGTVSFPNSPATVQITFSSVKLCLSVSESDCFHDSWNETLILYSMQFVLVRVFVLFISIPVDRSLGPSQQPVTPVCGHPHFVATYCLHLQCVQAGCTANQKRCPVDTGALPTTLVWHGTALHWHFNREGGITLLRNAGATADVTSHLQGCEHFGLESRADDGLGMAELSQKSELQTRTRNSDWRHDNTGSI